MDASLSGGAPARIRTLEEHRRAVIDQTMANSLRPVSAVLALAFGGGALASPYLLPPDTAWKVSLPAGLTALTLAVFVCLTRHREIPQRYVHAATFMLVLPALVVMPLPWYLTGHPHHAAGLMILALAAGALMLSTPWVVLTLVSVAVAWTAVATTVPWGSPVLNMGVLQVISIAVGGLVHKVRRDAHRRIGDLMSEAEDKQYLLAQQARLDELTGMLNRRAFMSALNRKMQRSDAPDSNLALLMIDLDDFKRINDTWGHPAGDAALKEFARRVQGTLRITDVFGRYGGEEFACILPQTDLRRARKAAERIRDVIASEPFRIEAHNITVTASLGLIVVRSAHGLEPESLLKAADAALFKAKADGKNRVVLANAPGTFPILI
jgi:diguanylate cyclase (GGDEF)-like protein